MQKILKKILLALTMIAISIPIGIYVYNYGAPISYELTAVTNTGKVIKLPNDWVHMAWTPQYLIANSFHNFINASYAIGLQMYNVLVAFQTLIGLIPTVGWLALLLIRKLRNKDPSTFINGGPYKAFGF